MTRRLVWLLVACLSIVAFAGQALCEDTVKLEYKFTPDELLRYDMSLVTQDDFLGSDMRIHGILRVRIVRILPNGDAELRMAYESGVFSAMGQVEEFDKKLQPVTFTMSKTGVIKDMKKVLEGDKGKVTVSQRSDDEYGYAEFSIHANAYECALEVISNAFPKEELKAGDIWTERLELLTVGHVVMAQCRLGDVQVEEDGAAVSRFTKHAVSEARDASGPFPGTEKVELNARISFCAERGLIIRYESDTDYALILDGEDGDSHSLNLKAKTTMKLLPAREDS